LRGKREQQRGESRCPESNQMPTKPEASPWLRGDPSYQADSETASGARMSGTIGSSGG
jgi:hypothetical protein